jgi:hypothetical protein
MARAKPDDTEYVGVIQGPKLTIPNSVLHAITSDELSDLISATFDAYRNKLDEIMAKKGKVIDYDS